MNNCVSSKSMKKTIILHGHLAEKFPDSITVEADTIAEALQALTQFQELSPPPGERWAVQVDGITTQEQLFEITDIEEIHVRPETGGAGGRGGIAQIVIGIVMVAVALFAPQALMALKISQGSMFLSGAMMITGGILQMLAPMPEVKEGSDPQSMIMRGAGNTTRIGTPIPLAYGTQPLYGHYLSFDVDAVDWTGRDEDVPAVTRDVRTLPQQSNTVGVYPLPGATNSAGTVQGIYTELDKPSVQFSIVNPVFASATTGASNIPVSSWIV